MPPMSAVRSIYLPKYLWMSMLTIYIDKHVYPVGGSPAVGLIYGISIYSIYKSYLTLIKYIYIY